MYFLGQHRTGLSESGADGPAVDTIVGQEAVGSTFYSRRHRIFFECVFISLCSGGFCGHCSGDCHGEFGCRCADTTQWSHQSLFSAQPLCRHCAVAVLCMVRTLKCAVTVRCSHCAVTALHSRCTVQCTVAVLYTVQSLYCTLCSHVL